MKLNKPEILIKKYWSSVSFFGCDDEHLRSEERPAPSPSDQTGLSFYRRFISKYYIFVVIAFLPVSCEKISDTIRNYGLSTRQRREQKLSSEEVEKWKRDLNISDERARELHEKIHYLVQETNLQGMLSWKIAKAYMEDARYDMAAMYYEGAMNNSLPDGPMMERERMFEDSLPYFKKALKLHRTEPELLFEAGLCFANASRSQGWEIERWKTAVFLFTRMNELKPDDLRPAYQLALLYGFTTKGEVKDQDHALELLRWILKKEETNISARFTLANILVQRSDFETARAEYLKISEILKDMHSSGILSGPVGRNQKYKQTLENIEKLDNCIADSPSCEIMRQ